MYDKAMSLFTRANFFIGQAHTYWCKGNFYFSTGENSEALEMYNKALFFFKKAKYLQGAGNTYLQMGAIYLCPFGKYVYGLKKFF
jgi:tetratricopeptide (TPR) repeat protein